MQLLSFITTFSATSILHFLKQFPTQVIWDKIYQSAYGLIGKMIRLKQIHKVSQSRSCNYQWFLSTDFYITIMNHMSLFVNLLALFCQNILNKLLYVFLFSFHFSSCLFSFWLKLFSWGLVCFLRQA